MKKPTGDAMKVMTTVAEIQSHIMTLGDVQVVLDRDLAAFYGVEPRVLNQAVKRNLDRFPERFMHQLTKAEYENLKSQIVISRSSQDGGNLKSQTVISSWGGDRRLPKVFTEQGVSMLSAVLRSPAAVDISIRIMDAFVKMRKTLASLAPMLARIEANERRQIADQTRNEANQEKNEERFKLIFDAMNGGRFSPQKVFYDGEVFDAHVFAVKHILSAKKSILLIDSWVDAITLEMLAQKKAGVTVDIVTSPRGNHISASDVATFNAQYGGLIVRTSRSFHDRFLIVDDKALYLFGASIKDLGKKCFAFTKLDASEISGLKSRI